MDKMEMGGLGRSQTVDEQLAELTAEMQRLEATVQQQSGSSSGQMPMSGTPGRRSSPKSMQGKMDGMADMAPGNSPSGGTEGEMGMMGMMIDRMMATMDKMMGRGATPAAAAMPGTVSGEGMLDMDKMEMAGMMGMIGGHTGGKGGSSMATSSALPGFPGRSHLYHIGATDFFLNHAQHISLTTEQQAALNKAKEQALLANNTADRAIQQAEQELWTLTAADQPDNAPVEAKIAEIEKLRGDARLRFINAVGEAAKILSDEQRKTLTGFAPPPPSTPAEAPIAAVVKGT